TACEPSLSPRLLPTSATADLPDRNASDLPRFPLLAWEPKRLRPSAPAESRSSTPVCLRQHKSPPSAEPFPTKSQRLRQPEVSPHRSDDARDSLPSRVAQWPGRVPECSIRQRAPADFASTSRIRDG